MKAGMPVRLVTILLLALVLAGKPGWASNELVLGVHPYKSHAKLLNSFTPLAGYLSEKTGLQIKIRISKDYRTHIDSIGNNSLDIAYMGPASYIKLVQQFGKRPILACQTINDKPTFHGKIIARKDSNINSLEQLKGRRFAFGDPNSTMSHLVPRYMLIKAGVTTRNLENHKFLGSHDNVALAVLAGDFDAGAVKEAVFHKYQKRGLKAIADTPALYEHLFVTSNKLKPALIRKLRTALLELHKDPRGTDIMSSIKPGLTGMYPVKDRDYDNLRNILDALKKSGVTE